MCRNLYNPNRSPFVLLCIPSLHRRRLLYCKFQSLQANAVQRVRARRGRVIDRAGSRPLCSRSVLFWDKHALISIERQPFGTRPLYRHYFYSSFSVYITLSLLFLICVAEATDWVNTYLLKVEQSLPRASPELVKMYFAVQSLLKLYMQTKTFSNRCFDSDTSSASKRKIGHSNSIIPSNYNKTSLKITKCSFNYL